MIKSYCMECHCYVARSQAIHNYTKKHQRTITPISTRRKFKTSLSVFNTHESWYENQWKYAEENA